MKLGAQLYTVHDYVKNLKDFDESLKKIADIGYEYVQVSGTCAYPAQWLADTLKKYGLKCCLTHISEDHLVNATDYVIENHKTFDCPYIGIGGLGGWWNGKIDINEVVADFKERFIPVAQKIKDAGKYFMYHNHHLEFAKLSDGRTAYQALIEDIPADILGFTVDTYWVQKGGCNPADIIRDLKGRCPVVHFKDFKLERTPEKIDSILAACGDGNLDFAKIAEACEYAGTEYVVVEQDDCFGEDPFVCLERSYKYLKSLGI